MSRTVALDQLPRVHELNRAFLGLLQARVRQQRSCFGLPPAAWPAVRTASAALLDGLAVVPRALFRIALGVGGRSADGGLDFDDPERQLCLSVLLEARTTSRHSAYQARLLFELDAADVARLVDSSLADVQRLAWEPGVLKCALCEPHWFWHWLFTTTRPELRRQLTLMALQPRIAEWPLRRPARVTT